MLKERFSERARPALDSPAPASRPWSLSLLDFHVAAQNRVDPRPLAPALRLEEARSYRREIAAPLAASSPAARPCRNRG